MRPPLRKILASAITCCQSDSEIKKRAHYKAIGEEQKADMVVFTDAIVDKRAVVIETTHAQTAVSAVA